MKAAFITTYEPRECGIATFTGNLIRSMNQDDNENGFSPFVVAMDDREESYPYPPLVKFTIRESHQRDYLKAADFINYNADVCILQHEFGIFGGKDGVYILPLLHRLKVPLLVTFHTVLDEPTFSQKAIIQEIGKQATKIAVMSQMAVKFLTDIYGINKKKINIIEHGLPDFDFSRHDVFKKKYRIEDKISLMTFGLISRGKGIETVIRALPEVVEKHNNVQYTILGKTHPNVLKQSGEEYRNFLKRLVKQLNVTEHVEFVDTFLEEEALCEYLSAIDVYITPYPNEAQITSGTLAYAVGAGAAVVSTPYWHARELLDGDRGVLFQFNDHNDLSEKLNQLLADPDRMKQIQKNASGYGKKNTWPQQGEKYRELAQKAIIDYRKPNKITQKVIDPTSLPRFTLTHVKRLTDNTGILQHARFNIPDYNHGYCIDDNARALLATTTAYHRQKEPGALDLISIYVSYIQYAQNEDGTFHNFMSYDRRFLDQKSSEDAFGRTIWALGFLIEHAPNDALFQIANSLFLKSVQQFDALTSLRGMANTIIGICYYLDHFQLDEGMANHLKKLANKLVQAFRDNDDTDWHWFEQEMTYENGLIPAALFYAYGKVEFPEYLEVARKSLEFLDNITFVGDHVSLVGNEQWYKKGGKRSRFDQQPIDALAMVLLYARAYWVLDRNKVYLEKMFTTFMWFFGENDLRLPLYDYETKGCCDGLEKNGVNRNQGAESTLAYLLAHLYVLIIFENE